MTLSTSSDNQLLISTEFVSPLDGVVFPNAQGVYRITFELLNSTDYNVVFESIATFTKIGPNPLKNVQVSHEIKSKGQKNMFTFQF